MERVILYIVVSICVNFVYYVLFVNRVVIENYCLIVIKRDCYFVNILENVLDMVVSRWESVSLDLFLFNWIV